MEWVSVAERIWSDLKGTGSRRTRLSLRERLTYGAGQVFNDLCASVWLTYLLIYFHKVVGLSSAKTGYLFVIAQLVDAIATPFIGIACDRYVPWCFAFYGRRKFWHLVGSLLVTFTWPFLFSPCKGCDENSSQSELLGHYAVVVIFLQTGWACVQVSHAGIISALAQSDKDVMELNAIRSGLSFGCGIFVFCVMWILLGQGHNAYLTPESWKHFMTIGVVITALGFIASAFFHFGAREPEQRNRQQEEAQRLNNTIDGQPSGSQVSPAEILSTQSVADTRTCRSWRQWLNDPDFYKMGVVYTCTRVALHVSQAYFVFYLTDTLLFHKEAIAYFPLVVLITGAIVNAGFHKLNNALGNKWTYCLASVVVLMGCLWFQLQSPSNKNAVFVSAIMLGSGVSVLLMTSMAMTSDLVSRDKESSGFVYSAMRLLDRGFVGLVVMIIQKNYPDNTSDIHLPACGDYARLVFTLTPAIAVIIALLTVLVTFDSNIEITCKKKGEQEDGSTQTVITFQSATFGSVYGIDEDDEELTLAGTTPTVIDKHLGESTPTVTDNYRDDTLHNPRKHFPLDPGPRGAFSAPDRVDLKAYRGYEDDDYSIESLVIGPDYSTLSNDEVKEKDDDTTEKECMDFSHIRKMPSTNL